MALHKCQENLQDWPSATERRPRKKAQSGTGKEHWACTAKRLQVLQGLLLFPVWHFVSNDDDFNVSDLIMSRMCSVDDGGVALENSKLFKNTCTSCMYEAETQTWTHAAGKKLKSPTQGRETTLCTPQHLIAQNNFTTQPSFVSYFPWEHSPLLIPTLWLPGECMKGSAYILAGVPLTKIYPKATFCTLPPVQWECRI